MTSKNEDLAARCWIAQENIEIKRAKVDAIDVSPAAYAYGRAAKDVGVKSYSKYDNDYYKRITDPLKVLAGIKEMERLLMEVIKVQSEWELANLEYTEAKAEYERLKKEWEESQ